MTQVLLRVHHGQCTVVTFAGSPASGEPGKTCILALILGSPMKEGGGGGGGEPGKTHQVKM